MIEGEEQFWREVLPAERQEIERRKRAALGREELDESDRELVGLALSGGGIRSATFGLGVIQGLARHGVLPLVDYLSTVSGGGFIGSWLSSLLSAPGGARSPFERVAGGPETAALVHLRNTSNYLAPGGLLDQLRLPTLFLRGALINLLLLLPWVMLAVMLTEIACEYPILESVRRWGPLAAVVLFGGMVVLFPVISRLLRDRLSWSGRNLLELILTGSLLTAILLLLVLPLTYLVGSARELSWEDLKYSLAGLSETFLDQPWKWVVVVAVVVLMMLAAPASTSLGKLRSKLVLYLLGLLAPLFVLTLYFVLCVIQIDSPNLVEAPELVRVRTAAPVSQLDEAATFAELEMPELEQALQGKGVRVAPGARLEAVVAGRQWRLTDFGNRRIFLLQKKGDHRLAVAADLQTEYANGFFSPALKQQLRDKGVVLEASALARVAGSAAFVKTSHEVTESQLSRASVKALRERRVTRKLRDELETLGMGVLSAAHIEGHAEPVSYQVTVRGAGGEAEPVGEPLEIPGQETRWTLVSEVLEDDEGVAHAVVMQEGNLTVANFKRQVWSDESDPEFFSAWLIFLLFSLLVDPNQTSWHGFYRDRLSRAYLVRSSALAARVPVEGLRDLGPGRLGEGWRARLRTAGLPLSRKARVRATGAEGVWLIDDGPQRFSALLQGGVGERDGMPRRSLAVYRVLEFNDQLKLSQLNEGSGAAPYHLINAALNLAGSADPNLRGRNADFFLFSKLFTGGARTGYAPTVEIEELDDHLNLGTAMAISGAAASPNMGSTTIRSLVLIMTMLNIRLGYWLPNPKVVLAGGTLDRLRARFGVGAPHLLLEGLGMVRARGLFVNLSDGGHVENLGVYELLRRRCRLIIAVDAEEDAAMGFASLVRLIRYASIDLGIDIELDFGPIVPDQGKKQGKKALSSSHWALGRIHYGSYGGGKPGDVGYLLYLKASLTGKERDYVRSYAASTAFPHESTADQFFSETQFEAYRALGEQIGSRTFTELGSRIGDAPSTGELLELVRAAADAGGRPGPASGGADREASR